MSQDEGTPPKKPKDDARKIVLARRARFLAATAIATANIACPEPSRPTPQPCLSQPQPQGPDDGGVPAPPTNPVPGVPTGGTK